MKFIKNLILVAAALFLCSVAYAQTFQSLPFVNGWNLVITNGVIVTNGVGNNVYTKSWVQTNVLVAVTNSANGLVTSNWASSYAPVTQTNANALSDVGLWANRDGTAPLANISVDVVGGVANFTNAITLVFYPVAYSSGLRDNQITSYASTSPSFSWLIAANGTSHVVVSTNMPTSFIQGCRALRLQTITPSSETASGAGTISVYLNGYKPSGQE